MSGPAYGGNNDYMILRLPRNAYPLSPALRAPKKRATEAFNTGVLGSAPQTSEGAANNTAGVQIFPLAKKSSEETTEDATEEEKVEEKPAD